MQYIAIIAAILTLFKDTFANIFKSRESKFVLIGLGAYYLYTTTRKKEQKEEILGNLANNEAGLLAQQLFTAFHPLISTPLFGYYLPDGTDEDAVESIAIQMGKKKNYSAVSEAYQILHGNTLDDDLRSEGVFDLFFNAYNAQSGNTGGAGNNNPTNPQYSNKGMKKGDIVYSNGGWNLRSTDAPYNPIALTVKGEDWILWNNPYISTIGGKQGYWVVVEQPKSRYIFSPSYYVVSLDALYKK